MRKAFTNLFLDLFLSLYIDLSHYMKSVQPNTELFLVRIFLTRNNFVFGHISRSIYFFSWRFCGNLSDKILFNWEWRNKDWESFTATFLAFSEQSVYKNDVAMEKRKAAVLKIFTFKEQLMWQKPFVNKKRVRLKCFW